MNCEHKQRRNAERQQLVGRGTSAKTDLHGDLQRFGEVGGFRREQEFKQAAKRQCRTETGDHQNDDGAAT